VDTRSVQIRNPQAGDVIGTHVAVAGIGVGFEGTVNWNLMRGEKVLASGGIQIPAGGDMKPRAFAELVELADAADEEPGPAVLQVYGDNPAEDGPQPGFDVNEVPVILIPGTSAFEFYKVKSGDTLSSIAQAHERTSVDAIVMANSDDITNPDDIQAGQTLRVPLFG
jgi:nucleoid-associated protein YgaU